MKSQDRENDKGFEKTFIRHIDRNVMTVAGEQRASSSNDVSLERYFLSVQLI